MALSAIERRHRVHLLTVHDLATRARQAQRRDAEGLVKELQGTASGAALPIASCKNLTVRWACLT